MEVYSNIITVSIGVSLREVPVDHLQIGHQNAVLFGEHPVHVKLIHPEALAAAFLRSLPEGKKMAEEALTSGRAFEKLKEMIVAQSGDVSYLDDPSKFPAAPYVETCEVPEDGYVAAIDAQEVGETCVELGGGRHQKTDPVDHRVGIEIHHKVGDEVYEGDPLFTIHAHDEETLAYARLRLYAAHRISREPVAKLPQFYGIIE